jgi:hypothetical protein
MHAIMSGEHILSVALLGCTVMVLVRMADLKQ